MIRTEYSQPLLDRPLRVPIASLLVLAIVLLQWTTFVAFADREVTWAYPGYFDQSAYLALSYRAFEEMLSEGLFPGLWASVTAQVPQGNLLHPQAALLYLLRGPSRLSALTLNWLYLIFLEGAVVYTLHWLTRRWSVAFIGLGLLLTTKARFAGAGGLMDFRTDFGALCLYGIVLCAVIRSGVFESFRWAVVAGIAIAWIVLFRHLTAMSIMLVAVLLLVFMGVRALSKSQSASGKDLWLRRAKGVVICGVVALFLAAPTLWTTRQTILSYYGVITTTDEGRVRIDEAQVSRMADFLLFYPKSLLSDHLGTTCVAAMVLILAVTLPVFIRASQETSWALPRLSVDSESAFVFLAAAFISSLVVLTIFPARSPVVAGFLVPPLIGGVLAMAVAFARAGNGRASTNFLLTSLSAVVLSAGIYTEVSASSRKSMYSEHRQDINTLGGIYDEIGLRSARWGWTSPRVAFDRIHDYLHPGILEPWFYERHRVLTAPIAELPRSILPATADDALAAISVCDFAVLTDPSSPDDPGFPYPFNQSMKDAYAKLHAAAEQQLIPIRHFEVYSQQLTLYMRPPLRFEGESGGWVTSSGLVIVGPGELLREYPTIELRGRNILFQYLGDRLDIRAQLLTPGQQPKDVPASITRPGPEYSVVIHLDPSDIRTDQDVRVKILFDKYVVPKAVGFNEDTRQLVIMTPAQVRARRN